MRGVRDRKVVQNDRKTGENDSGFVKLNNVRIFANDNMAEQIKNRDYSASNEQLARFAKALGHPARITIMEFLAEQDSCFFGDIHDELPIAKATVSQHLKELKDAGLIQGEIEPPKVRYCIDKENWALAKGLFRMFFGHSIYTDGCCR